jgi:prepilin-type N-terminal cleavage/methylation domain-containing protein
MKYSIKQGYSLLEIMLVLVVVALILVVSIRYYGSARNKQQVSAAIAQVKKITNASYQWLSLQNQSDFSAVTSPNGAAGTAISIALLQSDNLISSLETTDPWGGAVTVSAGANPATVRISMAGLNATNCKQLVLSLNNSTVSQLPKSSCTGSSITYYGDF